MTNQLDIFKKFSLLQETQTVANDRTLHAKDFGAVYHNTTDLHGKELDKAQTRASKQTEVILKVFQDHPHTSFSPWDVYYHLGQQYMITSVRRAITTLTDAGYLVKGERKRSGPANEWGYVWKLKR